MRLALLLLACTLAHAQSAQQVTALMDAPTPKVTRSDLAFLGAEVALRTTDVIETRVFLGRGGREAILPNWIVRSTPRLAAYSAIAVGAEWFAMRRLERHHKKLAMAYRVGVLVAESYCVGTAVHAARWGRVPGEVTWHGHN